MKMIVVLAVLCSLLHADGVCGLPAGRRRRRDIPALPAGANPAAAAGGGDFLAAIEKIVGAQAAKNAVLDKVPGGGVPSLPGAAPSVPGVPGGSGMPQAPMLPGGGSAPSGPSAVHQNVPFLPHVL